MDARVKPAHDELSDLTAPSHDAGFIPGMTRAQGTADGGDR